jgi:hypothetical protein
MWYLVAATFRGNGVSSVPDGEMERKGVGIRSCELSQQ